MPSVGSTDISFNSLRTAWGNAGYAGGSDPGSTNISLSEFRGATFTGGTSVPSSGEISIKDDFKDKTFGSSSIVYNTGSFRVYDNWSAYSTKLKGTTGSSTFTGSTTAYKRVKLYTGQSSYFPYPIILLTPNATNSSTSPGLIVDRSNSNAVDEATVWFRVVTHNGYNQVQMGIVAKDMTLDDWSTQKSYLHNKHATYCDRLAFHGAGYHNYAGSRDDITSSSTIVSPQYKTGTYGSYLTSNFHNRTGTTAGTMRSYNAASAPTGGYNMYFFKNSYYNYSNYRGSSKNPNHGLKIKWYETTLQAKLVDGSSTILPVSGNWSSSDLEDVFSGMYVSGEGIPTGKGAFIGDIHTNYMVLYQGKGNTGIPKLPAEEDESNTTLTISGYLYWTLTTGHDSSNSNTNYVNPKIMGPPHTVLPKYQAVSSGSTTSVEIKEWAFFIGDTTSGTNNYLDYDLRNTDPGGTAFSYSVTYGTGTLPSDGVSSGIYMGSSALSSGNKGTSLQQVTFDLSGSSYAGTSVVGETGKIVFKYRSGTSYTGDIQLVRITVNGSATNIGASYSNWRRNSTYHATTYPGSGSSGWTTIPTSQTAGHWCHDYYNTPSSYTGVSIPSTYNYRCIYYEASGAGHTYKVAWLRGPSTTFTSNSVTIYFYAYGGTMGSLYAGVDIE
tara:strand:+ start:933 stop:2924 length:1992 start_codon:yes stop_codon:yes gene_type:complete